MQYYRFRIDALDNLNLDDLVQMSGSAQHVIVKHELPHGNPHYHMYLKTNIKQANFRKKLKALLPNIQKSDYSLKTCDESRINEFVQYMFNTKHNNKWELYDSFNFDNTVLNDCIQAAKSVSADFIKSVSNKQKGPTIYDLAVEINEAYKTGFLQEHNNKEQYRIFLELAIKICHKHRKAFEENMLRRLVSTAITLTSHQGRHTIVRKIMDKEFRNIEL